MKSATVALIVGLLVVVCVLAIVQQSEAQFGGGFGRGGFGRGGFGRGFGGGFGRGGFGRGFGGGFGRGESMVRKN